MKTKSLLASLLFAFAAGCGGGTSQTQTQAEAPRQVAGPIPAQRGDTTVEVTKMDPIDDVSPRPAAIAQLGEGSRPMPLPDARAETEVVLLDGSGTAIGKVTIEQAGKQVTFSGTFTGLKPGLHGIHIHENGNCGGKAAANAGGHFNPSHVKHGPPQSAMRHVGDFGNLLADKTGAATFNLTTDSVTVVAGPDSVVGRAIVVHSGKDDGTSQPSGNSGPPVACGVIVGR